MRKEITEDQITQLLAGIARAEEVDQLRAENERLRGALREAALMSDCCAWCRAEVADFCREALKAKP